MRVINSIPWSSTEIESYRQIIWTNLIDGMTRVREVMDELNLETSEDNMVRPGGRRGGRSPMQECPVSAQAHPWRGDVQLTDCGFAARPTGALRSSRLSIRFGRSTAISTSISKHLPNSVGRLCSAEGASSAVRRHHILLVA